jgi:hypothetical protein
LHAAVFPVADAGGAQADVNLRRRQVAASLMCAGSATLQLMVHTALASISTKSRRQFMAWMSPNAKYDDLLFEVSSLEQLPLAFSLCHR